ncbi:hypothetical protein [Pseudomonas atagonensis]|uniref:hypothetical protein n=1 Tax=Pseudomonas atagonensis TaxID=2609964 RepID=UPI00140BE749|nr:hypothetical protein [Pseudomonas atagonensis]
MALIDCYECKRSISNQALVCIHCGAPLAEYAQVQNTPAEARTATISFGSLPRNNAVPDAVAPPVSTPLPKVMPAAAGRRRRQQAEQAVQAPSNPDGSRPVEGWLKIMVFLMPMVFVWFLLRNGHSNKQRLFGFGWLALLILASSLPK